MTRVDFCITTMDRPQALERLLLSLSAHYPDASIHVADQSIQASESLNRTLNTRLRAAGLRRPPAVHRLPPDCGVSAARNYLAEATPGDYKLFLDDDFVFTERSDVSAMVSVLDANPSAGVVGGSVGHGGKVRNVGTVLERRDRTLHQLEPSSPLAAHDGIRFRRTDCVPMFALMRRELLERTQWDPALKTAGEHFDFFLGVRKTPYSVLHLPDVLVDHLPIDASPDYARRRWRSEFLARMLAKHGLSRLRTIDRTVVELRADGELVAYCNLDD